MQSIDKLTQEAAASEDSNVNGAELEIRARQSHERWHCGAPAHGLQH